MLLEEMEIMYPSFPRNLLENHAILPHGVGD